MGPAAGALQPRLGQRFQVVVDTVGWLLERTEVARPRLVDLGCGTGSLTVRLARAFPHADVVGVDADPRLLGLAEGAVSGTTARLLARDLTTPGWADEAGPPAPWDAAVSSTALHWLTPTNSRRSTARWPGACAPEGSWSTPTTVLPPQTLPPRTRPSAARAACRPGRASWPRGLGRLVADHPVRPGTRPLAQARSPIAQRTFTEPHDLTTAEQIRLLHEAGFTLPPPSGSAATTAF